MIVCSCNIITKSEIEEVVYDFLDQDGWQLITVGMVYHAMRKRGRCCGCFPNAIAIIVDAVESWHARNDTPQAEIIPLIARTRQAFEQTSSRGNRPVSELLSHKAA